MLSTCAGFTDQENAFRRYGNTETQCILKILFQHMEFHIVIFVDRPVASVEDRSAIYLFTLVAADIQPVIVYLHVARFAHAIHLLVKAKLCDGFMSVLYAPEYRFQVSITQHKKSSVEPFQIGCAAAGFQIQTDHYKVYLLTISPVTRLQFIIPRNRICLSKAARDISVSSFLIDPIGKRLLRAAGIK